MSRAQERQIPPRDFARTRLDGAVLIRVCGQEMRRTDLWMGLGLGAVALLVAFLSLLVGATDLGLRDLLHPAQLNESQRFALWSLRVPRALTGFLAGGAVAVAGAMLQSLTRNPIADPGLLGLAQGSLLAILAAVFLLPGIPEGWVPLIGSGGGLVVAGALIWLTGQGGAGRGDALALLLLGLAVETTLSSLTAIVVLYAPSDLSFSISVWLAGSLYQAGWATVAMMLPWLALGAVLVFVAGPMLRLLELGEERALALGLGLRGATFVVLVATVLLTSSAVAATGPLVFLGILAPHISRFLLPASGRARLVQTGLLGGVFVLAADCVSRVFGADIGLPIGLCLTLLGVPVFIVILRLRSAAQANQGS